MRARLMQGLAGHANGLGRAAARLLFPPVCAGCRTLVSEPGTLCAACWPALRFIEHPVCPVYGTPFSHDMGNGMLSAEAIAHPPVFARARSAVSYDGVARRMVQGLKYHDRTDLAWWMAGWMLRAGGELVADASVIVPVPLHRWRFFSRRYNQSAELARALSRRTGLPHAPQALVRTRRTAQQVGLDRNARESNVRGAFSVPDEALPEVSGRNVLLVDDVYTTGATVGAASRALRKAGAAQIDVLTFARVLPGDFSLLGAGTI
ncbi:MAG: ComF family protein [Notoacmeibacter sp.]|nr:ComF family protein [Notoacmeibacter sp.]